MTSNTARHFVIYFDRNDDSRPLVSRHVFNTREDALHHAKIIGSSWNPIVVSEIADE